MLTIDQELRALIPPLQEAERQLLEDSVLSEGCRDPLVIWRGRNILVDGHNRYEICQEHGLPYDIIERDFADRYAVIEWMCVNQLGRRNLTDAARADLRGKRYNNEKQRVGRPSKITHNESIAEPTYDRIAREENVSRATIQRDAKFSEALDVLENIGVERRQITSGKRKVKQKDVITLAQTARENPDAAKKAWVKVEEQGDTSGAIKAALRDVRNEEAALVIEASRDELVQIHHGDFAALSMMEQDGSFDAIITDPPYPAEFLPTWTSLAEVAMRVLKPGGWCIAYTGKQHLDEVMRRMTDAGLAFYWQIIFKQTVTATIHARKVNTTYKPILLFQKPPITQPEGYFMDIIQGRGMEKDGHEWQQSEDGFEWLIQQFTNVGDRIMEPFSGSGTCPAVAKRLSRFCVAYEIDEKAYAASCRRVFP